ncbi:hypothetical protein [Sphingobacterium sp. T2]|uniref:hypothetical protein n=1 Tax=Sphingobacterium sp. T2 TaxID=1590596 RepID=UPI000AD6FFC4|nr:hypothetical protein [Sphingobacterium sp. T2]
MLIFISLYHNAEFDEGKVFVKLKLMDIEEQDDRRGGAARYYQDSKTDKRDVPRGK